MPDDRDPVSLGTALLAARAVGGFATLSEAYDGTDLTAVLSYTEAHPEAAHPNVAPPEEQAWRRALVKDDDPGGD